MNTLPKNAMIEIETFLDLENSNSSHMIVIDVSDNIVETVKEQIKKHSGALRIDVYIDNQVKNGHLIQSVVESESSQSIVNVIQVHDIYGY